jgi:DNA-binding NtrC family response regulator
LQARLGAAFLSEQPAAAPGPRVLAGSTADPQAEVLAGRLLEPLACALSTLTVVLPPLRQRLDDLPWLVERALARACQNTPRRVTEVSEDAWHSLRTHPWPGNLRELYTVLSSACARAQGGRIEAGDLPWYVRASAESKAPNTPAPPLDAVLDEVEARLGKLRGEVEKRLLVQALRRARGNRTRASELLAISRPRLLRRIKELGVAGFDDEAEPPPDAEGGA